MEDISCNKKVLLKRSYKLRGKNIYIIEDFSYDTMVHRKQLWEKVKSLCSQGKFTYLSYRSIVVEKI